jgi:CMP-N-acetylneuraminic acid synthetase
MAVPDIKALLFMKAVSERVPGKNMKPFCGRPLFHWILDSLTRSKWIREIVINTDSDEIAASAEAHYRVTLHRRPEHLLRINHNEAYQLMAHDLSLTEGEYFLQTHATTPLIRAETIDRAIETFFGQRTHDSLISVTPVRKRFFTSRGVAVNHDPDALIKTQELPPLYEENSCIYIFSRAVMETRRNRIGSNPLFFEMDPYESVDIDVPFDFTVAEAVMRERNRTDSAMDRAGRSE